MITLAYHCMEWFICFLKYMPWSCEIPTSLVSRNVCNDENCRFNKIPWNQVNVNGFDNLTIFLIKFFKAKSTWQIWQFFHHIHYCMYFQTWNKLPCKGLMCFSFFFFFFFFFLLPCSLSQDPDHLIATSFLSFKLNSTAQWGKDLLP